MSVIDEVLSNNIRYAESFDKGDLPLPPGRKLAVLACMDARLDPHRILGVPLSRIRLTPNFVFVVP